MDASGKVTRVRPEGWTEASPAASVRETLADRIDGPDEPDAVVTGRTRELAVSGVHLNAVSVTTDDRTGVLEEGRSVAVPSDEWLVKADTTVTCYLRFDGAARLELRSQERALVSFPEPTAVSLGFAGTVGPSPPTVTVPETAAGVARWLTVAGRTPEVTDARRSWPSLRPQPPRLRFGPGIDVPDLDTSGGTDVTVRLPPSVAHVVSVAPLAYYLGARVETREGVTPHLVADGDRLSLADGFHRRTNHTLRRVFWLDCLVRSADEYGRAVAAADRLSAVGLDADRLVEAPMGRRLVRYLEVPVDRLDPPKWHWSATLPPTTTAAVVLPRLCATLAGVTPRESGPSGDTLEPVERNGDTPCGPDHWFARDSRTCPAVGRTATPNRESTVDTDTTDGSDVGATTRAVTRDGRQTEDERRRGVASDAVTADQSGGVRWTRHRLHVTPTTRAGMLNRDRYVDQADRLRMVTIVNDESFTDAAVTREASAVLEEYRTLSDQFGQRVTLRRNCSVGETARLFESGADVVHFLGHHDDGLVCPDGRLDADSLTTSNARTFLLNACGSHRFGRRLIERGSVAGGVTFDPVMDETAVRVGVSFARFLNAGFCVAAATAAAQYDSLAETDYGVVGDGMHRVTEVDGGPANRTIVESVGVDRYRVTRLVGCADKPGGQSMASFDDDPHLYGTPATHELSAEALDDWLAVSNPPVFFDGEVVRPERLRERL